MFNQHYLNPMFLPSKSQNQIAEGQTSKNSKSGGKDAGDDEYHVGDTFEESFLDRLVSLDEELARRRESTILEEVGMIRRESGVEFGSGQVLKCTQGRGKDGHAKGDECVMLFRTPSDRVVAEEAKGKTVKNLSRLWKYLGGNSPVDDDNKPNGLDGEPHHDYSLNPDGQENPDHKPA